MMNQIVLTGQQALALRQTAAGALKQTGRIEFGLGAVDPIIEAFSDSPYLTRENREETLSELSGREYLVSLLREAQKADLIMPETAMRIQKEGMDIVADLAMDFTDG